MMNDKINRKLPGPRIRLSQRVTPLELFRPTIRIRKPGTHPVPGRLPLRSEQSVGVEEHAHEVVRAVFASRHRQHVLPRPESLEHCPLNPLTHD